MSKEFLSEFIEVYRRHPALWKIKSTEYINKNLKNLRLAALSEVCKKFKIASDRDFIKKKIQSLRSTFRKECNKVEKFIRSDRGSDEIYVPNLWYFELMMFIKDQEQPTQSMSNIASPSGASSQGEEDEDDEEAEKRAGETQEEQEETEEVNDVHIDSQESQVLSPSQSLNASSVFISQKRQQRKRTKKEETNEHRHFLKACTSALLSSGTDVSDDSTAFGAYVGKKLKSLPENSQKVYAETLITQVLQRTVMNTLSENTVLTDRQPPPIMNYNNTSPHYTLHNNSNNNTNVAVNNVPATITDETGSLQTYYSNFSNYS